jgi:general secretion pathway protein G
MARSTTPGDAGLGAGFTLIELITVVALISILAAIALPNYRVAIIQSKEAVLRENLFRLRDLIDQYYVDKGQYPPALENLVEDGYLRKLPEDPFTKAPDWTPVYSEPEPDRPGEPPGIYDVKSASELVSLEGTPYNEW